ncbi:MAG: hypothetical protein ACRENI_04360 [Gemmatimonadaceae bacterium]
MQHLDMQHLSDGRLAALADENPTRAEMQHLATCYVCRLERDAQLTLRALARAEAERSSLPLTRWDAIASALRNEGIPVRERTWSARPGARRSALRLAAALGFAAAGLVAGRYSAGASPIPGLGGGSAIASAEVRDATGVATGAADSAAGPAFSSIGDAEQAMHSAGELYQNAVAYLMLQDSSAQIEGSDLYRARLAALDEVASATRRALNEAPLDPVINRYYLTTMGARQATIRQLGTSLSGGVRLTQF